MSNDRVLHSSGESYDTPITRSPAQKPAHKGLGRNGQKRAIATKAAYAPVSKRAGSRFQKKRPFPAFSILTTLFADTCCFAAECA
ncbi:hypothetical protein EFO71_05790 [Lacticaseibacillus rhamnosus]|nr:hypothetical protein [Lacticaseibacillus rhamnosus]MCT3178197.1 hypothetical protein [Lacticaseibacillus rhamnosus]MCT3183738.1 hypothetical protein [Lacticaseibacillus rhamnosus]MCT4447915.1 hypothetical protein [Lacticaseibacillus rhamnosus]